MGLGICPSTSHSHTHTLLITCTCCYDEVKGTKDQDFSCSFSDSLSLSFVLVAVMKSKEFKTETSHAHAHSLILSLSLTLWHFCSNHKLLALQQCHCLSLTITISLALSPCHPIMPGSHSFLSLISEKHTADLVPCVPHASCDSIIEQAAFVALSLWLWHFGSGTLALALRLCLSGSGTLAPINRMPINSMIEQDTLMQIPDPAEAAQTACVAGIDYVAKKCGKGCDCLNKAFGGKGAAHSHTRVVSLALTLSLLHWLCLSHSYTRLCLWLSLLGFFSVAGSRAIDRWLRSLSHCAVATPSVSPLSLTHCPLATLSHSLPVGYALSLTARWLHSLTHCAALFVLGG